MYPEFKDKVVLVTGGTTGIGKTTAKAFAENGAKVIICGRRTDEGKQTETEADKMDQHIKFYQCDVSDAKQVEKMIDHIVKKFGDLHHVFNNAGIDGERGTIAECTLENWQKTMDINVNGVFYCMKYAIPQIIKSGGGCIVNNASVSGHRGYPGLPAYITSKHAVKGLTKAAATEFATENIRVNAISPGIIITPMFPEEKRKDEDFKKWVENIVPMKRMAKAVEVANCVLWLCSDQSSYVTGDDMIIDGGLIAR